MEEGKWWQGGLRSPNSVGSSDVPKATHTHGPTATLSVSLRYHGTGKRDHGTERGVELSRITVPRGTGIGREYVGWVSMVLGVSVMRRRRGVQGFVRSERARGITEGGVRDNGSLCAPLRAQPVQWDLGTHISHNGTEREGGSGTAGGRRGSHSLIDSETQSLFFMRRNSTSWDAVKTRAGSTPKKI